MKGTMTEKQKQAVINNLYKQLDKQLLAMEATFDKTLKNIDKFLKSIPTARDC